VRNPLRLVFRRRPEGADSPASAEPPPSKPALPLVEFVAFSEDCRLSGYVELAASRLTDMLNAHETYDLVDVLITPLDERSPVEIRTLEVARDELIAVYLAGPRGDSGRRQRTRQFPLAFGIGSFLATGYVHALPGSDPVQWVRRRPPMIPLTDGWLEHPQGRGRARVRAGALVVNREQADWIAQVEDEQVELPELSLPTEKSLLLKDFTGQVLIDSLRG